MASLKLGLEPEKFFNCFEALSDVPRGSAKEEKIADFIVSFAKARSLPAYRDKWHNVFVKIPASAGYENKPAVLLQGHTDMVCAADGGVAHDFEKTGIDLYTDGDFVRARGTTLGADDGAAVAVMLAAMDGAFETHPAVECLFTTREEIGLVGAVNFDYSLITARRMINMDSEQEGEAVVSCAGGVRTDIAFSGERTHTDGKAFSLSLTGLAGGHSGIDIELGRQNADKAMARILRALQETCRFRIVSFSGGTKDNAIPNSCEAVICTADEKAKQKAAAAAGEALSSLREDDAGCRFETAETDGDTDGEALTAEDTRRFIDLINLLPYGVISMSGNIKGLVETSSNVGIVSFADGEGMVTLSSRSSVMSELEWVKTRISDISRICGCKARHRDGYPAWRYGAVSPMRDAYVSVYKELFGREPQLTALHAGLECGVIAGALPDMDIISIGPTMTDVHTAREKLSISSCGRLFSTVGALLAKK